MFAVASALTRARVQAGYRWRFQGRHRFVDRSRGHEQALVILAGHKPFLWPVTLDRVAQHVPDHMDVCLVTPGVDRPELSALAERHGWSYLATVNGHVSLAQNLAIRALPRARLIYKLDEDIFVSEQFFESLLEGYRRVQSESDFAVGFCAPVINVNGFSYADFVGALDLEAAYRERFGELRRASDGIPAQNDGEAAVWLWSQTLPVDRTSARYRGRPFSFSIVPHRFSIGAILFERDLWQEMRAYSRGLRSPGLGEDEQYICVSCLTQSRIMAVVDNVFAGHFAFGPQQAAMRSAYESRLAEF